MKSFFTLKFIHVHKLDQTEIVLSKSRQHGFTLFEMLVVVLITAITIGFGVPSFLVAIERNHIASQMNDFIGVMHFARSQAIMRGTYVTVCRATSDTASSPSCSGISANGRIGKDWGTGYIVFVDDDETGAIGERTISGVNTELLLKRIPSHPKEFTMYRLGPPGEYITYNALGFLIGNRNNGVQYGFSGGNPSNGTDKTICIARGGRIRTVADTGFNVCQI